MLVKNNHEYRKITKIEYNNKLFQLFLDDYNKMAFLEINKNGDYIYPELLDVIALAKSIKSKDRFLYSKTDAPHVVKKYKFIPKVLYKGAIYALTVSLLTACGVKENKPVPTPTPEPTPIVQQQTVVEEYDDTIYREITDGFTEYLSPADDEYDLNWKYDYYKERNVTYVCDSNAYEKVFGYSKPTKEELIEILNQNDKIDPQTKEVIEDFLNKWFELWPESDFSVLKHNLSDMEIIKISEEELYQLTHTPSIVACYSQKYNDIYINNNSDYLNKNSEDYIIFIHELIHACRNTHIIENSTETIAAFHKIDEMGLYDDEALVNVFAKKIQGNTVDLSTYPLQTNYYDIITNAIDYTGEEYMNHSVNYLIEKMDNYMNDDNYAYHIVGLIDLQGKLRYDGYNAITTYDNFYELYNYIIDIYCKSNYKDESNSDTVLNGFDEFWNKISFGITGYHPYKGIKEDYMRKLYTNYVEEHYSNSKTL